jgi:hypothetical protein
MKQLLKAFSMTIQVSHHVPAATENSPADWAPLGVMGAVAAELVHPVADVKVKWNPYGYAKQEDSSSAEPASE